MGRYRATAKHGTRTAAALDLRVINPNDRDFDASGVSLQLNLNGQRLAQAVSSQAIFVPRLGETRIQVEASTTLFDLARQLLVLQER
ncbi:MAG: LEA type 2 family protein, partial [Gammaproteobacteria bacterium]|nr:LEA type 2 family protein [Gammaproteobacteria bacterium]